MADGSLSFLGPIICGPAAGALTLDDAVAAGTVVACCPICDHREDVDVQPWLVCRSERQSLLRALGRRLRCLCGSREIMLEVWPAPVRYVGRPIVFHFRA